MPENYTTVIVFGSDAECGCGASRGLLKMPEETLEQLRRAFVSIPRTNGRTRLEDDQAQAETPDDNRHHLGRLDEPEGWCADRTVISPTST